MRSEMFVASGCDLLVCPLCEWSNLYPSDQDSMRFRSCRTHLDETMLETLRRISSLRDTLGSHACKCNHPEMRLLSDGGSTTWPAGRRYFCSKPREGEMQVDGSEAQLFDGRTPMHQEISLWAPICSAMRISNAAHSSAKTLHSSVQV